MNSAARPYEPNMTYVNRGVQRRFLERHDMPILSVDPDGQQGIESVLRCYQRGCDALSMEFYSEHRAQEANKGTAALVTDLTERLRAKTVVVSSPDAALSALGRDAYAFVVTGLLGYEIGTDDRTSASGLAFVRELDNRGQLFYVVTAAWDINTHRTLKELPNLVAYTGVPGDGLMIGMLNGFLDGRNMLQQIERLAEQRAREKRADELLVAAIESDVIPNATSWDEVVAVMDRVRQR